MPEKTEKPDYYPELFYWKKCSHVGVCSFLSKERRESLGMLWRGSTYVLVRDFRYEHLSFYFLLFFVLKCIFFVVIVCISCQL